MNNDLIHKITEDILELESLNLLNEVDEKNLSELLKQLRALKTIVLKSEELEKCQDVYISLKMPIQTLLQ